jgi:hypothetical protein
MGEAISSETQLNLWEEVQRVVPSGKVSATIIDGSTEPEGIAEVFADKFDTLYQSVPTTAEELNDIRYILHDNIVHEKSLNECNISVNDVDCAIKKLNKRKGDGGKGFYSDHIIMSTHRFKTLLTMLINVMLVHGYNADNLLVSIIASIPKDLRSRLSNSDNYRGVSLCCSICKLIDYVFIDKYFIDVHLRCSDMQFAFKSSHDTTLCTAILKETVSYYLTRRSDIYACMLDASKAFDKVHFGKLFKLLIDRKIPSMVMRLLLDNDTHQNIFTSWNG